MFQEIFLEAARELSPFQETEANPQARELEKDWYGWLKTLFPEYFPYAFGEHHAEFWDSVWEIRDGERPNPFIAIWSRDHGKSTNSEASVVALGAKRIKRYALYVCATQDQADDHVQNIADMLEGRALEHFYPELSRPLIGKHGNAKGWRRNRLRTSSGFTVDAIGLDSAARGAKIEENRPDLIVLDDIDGENDSEVVVTKKIRALTRKILPAGAEDLAVLAVQNLVHRNSIFSKLADGSADFLTNRRVSGPIPAVEDCVIETINAKPTIIAGRATWDGMPLRRCQAILDDEGLLAFRSERLHHTRDPGATIFERDWWAKGKNRYDIHDPDREVAGRWLSLDLSMKDKADNSYNALTVHEISNPDYNHDLRYVWRERLSFPKLLPRIRRMCARWNYDDRLWGLIIEDKAHGITVIQTIEEGSDDWLKGFLVPFDPKGIPKEQRWEQAASWGELDCLRLPYTSTSREEVGDLFAFEEELYDLPSSEYKDWADSYAQGIIHLEHLIAEGWREKRRHQYTPDTPIESWLSHDSIQEALGHYG